MNPTRPRTDRQPTDFTPENRAETPSLAHSSTSAATAAVTVGRSDGVVQPSSALHYEVDPAGHRVVARYDDGRVAFAFGSAGSGPGQFNTPLHVTAVSPEFFGEPRGQERFSDLLTPWLAVADYGNHRVQFFECDGAFVGETELDAAQPPCHLTWRSPALEVTTVEGRVVRLHVAAALMSSSRRDTRHEPVAHSDPRRAWRVC